MKPIMKCGCVAMGSCSRLNGVEYNPPIPSCITHDCIEVAPAAPDLTGRVATCGLNCKSQRPSSLDLAFFEYRPNREMDSYYCGCRGWD